MGYDGVAYYSKRVDDELFALCAVNLALFINYNDTDKLVKHMKMDDAYNFFLYKQLDNSLKYRQYEFGAVNSGFITNIGNFDRQYPYRETDFYHFDEFLFSTWKNKPNGLGKDEIDWGYNL